MFYLYQKSQVLFIKPKSTKILKISNKKMYLFLTQLSWKLIAIRAIIFAFKIIALSA